MTSFHQEISYHLPEIDEVPTVSTVGLYPINVNTSVCLSVCVLAYGFATPLSSSMENQNAEEARFHHFIKASVVAFAKGFAPIVATEFARRAIFADVRPSFEEMEAACKDTRKK